MNNVQKQLESWKSMQKVEFCPYRAKYIEGGVEWALEKDLHNGDSEILSRYKALEDKRLNKEIPDLLKPQAQ